MPRITPVRNWFEQVITNSKLRRLISVVVFGLVSPAAYAIGYSDGGGILPLDKENIELSSDEGRTRLVNVVVTPNGYYIGTAYTRQRHYADNREIRQTWHIRKDDCTVRTGSVFVKDELGRSGIYRAKLDGPTIVDGVFSLICEGGRLIEME